MSIVKTIKDSAGNTFDLGVEATNVSGTLSIANGGTGATTANAAANALINGLPDWTADMTDTTKFIRQDTGGSATYGKVPGTSIWNYIKSKISSVLGLTESNYSGNAATATDYTASGGIATALAGKANEYADIVNVSTPISGWHIAHTSVNGKNRNPYFRAVVNITTWTSYASYKADECLGFIEINERMVGDVSTSNWNRNARIWSINARSAIGWALYEIRDTTNFTTDWYIGHYNSSNVKTMPANIQYCSLSIIPLAIEGNIIFDTSLTRQTAAMTMTDYWTTRATPWIGASQAGSDLGSTSVPVYVDANGQFQKATAVNATTITTSSGTDPVFRPVWFSYAGNNTKPVFNTNFQYNPGTNKLTADCDKVDGLHFSSTAGTDTSTVYLL